MNKQKKQRRKGLFKQLGRQITHSRVMFNLLKPSNESKNQGGKYRPEAYNQLDCKQTYIMDKKNDFSRQNSIVSPVKRNTIYDRSSVFLHNNKYLMSPKKEKGENRQDSPGKTKEGDNSNPNFFQKMIRRQHKMMTSNELQTHECKNLELAKMFQGKNVLKNVFESLIKKAEDKKIDEKVPEQPNVIPTAFKSTVYRSDNIKGRTTLQIHQKIDVSEQSSESNSSDSENSSKSEKTKDNNDQFSLGDECSVETLKTPELTYQVSISENYNNSLEKSNQEQQKGSSIKDNEIFSKINKTPYNLQVAKTSQFSLSPLN